MHFHVAGTFKFFVNNFVHTRTGFNKRREDLLLSETDLNKVWVLRKFLGGMNTQEGMEFLIDKMKKFKTNEEFLEAMNKKNGSAT